MSLFDRYYKAYDAWYDKNQFAYLSELETLKRVLPKVGKGLEIGVGTGRFAAPLGITLGIDPSHAMLELASRRGVNVRWGYGEDLPFLDTAFDYVAIIITLCFVGHPLKVVQEARRVLKDKGRLIVGIIDKNSFLGRWYQRKKSIFYKKAHFFSSEELGHVLKAAGFDRLRYYQTIFETPRTISRVERPRKGFGKGGFVVISANKKKIRR